MKLGFLFAGLTLVFGANSFAAITLTGSKIHAVTQYPQGLSFLVDGKIVSQALGISYKLDTVAFGVCSRLNQSVQDRIANILSQAMQMDKEASFSVESPDRALPDAETISRTCIVGASLSAR